MAPTYCEFHMDVATSSNDVRVARFVELITLNFLPGDGIPNYETCTLLSAQAELGIPWAKKMFSEWSRVQRMGLSAFVTFIRLSLSFELIHRLGLRIAAPI